MAGRTSYIIVRDDGLLLHTVPVTEDEAWWLYWGAYKSVRDRAARVRYLEEWGSVLDAGDYVRQLRELEPYIYVSVLGGFESPEEFEGAARWLLKIAGARPELGQVLEGLAAKVRELYRRPVEPRSLDGSAARYLEAHYRRFDDLEGPAAPKPEWLRAFANPRYLFGVGVFRETIWLWKQNEIPVASATQAVVVRRDASDGDVVAAVAGDSAVVSFLMEHGDEFRGIIDRYEAELTRRGYADVVRKVKIVLAAAELLTAGRKEEEGEALPA